jgi:hypothetical protein
MYNWNPVYNFVMSVKNDYINKFGNISYETSVVDGKVVSCLEKWVAELNNKEYLNIIEPLQLNQYGTLLLIRYGRYSDIYSGETEIDNDNFWDLYNGFYRECRSLVIDIKNDDIVLCPFRKFRNLNEGEENSLHSIQNRMKNAKSIEFTNKLDGSMQSAKWYNNKIVMSGSQAIDMENSWRLQDGYNRLISQDNYVNMIKDNSDFTFIFEYITLQDAHVVNYTKEQEGLYLIGIRNVYTGKQLSYHDVLDFAKRYNTLTTVIYNKTLEDVLADTKKYKSNEKEGFVLNIDGYMVKIKCDDYVHIAKILSNISSINLIIKSIADETFDDLISKVPESYRWRITKVANLVLNYIKNMDVAVKDYYRKAPKDSKKNFMIWIDNNVPTEYRGYVRNMYLGNENNYIKSGNKNSPKYKKLKEMGINENYSAIFVNEE